MPITDGTNSVIHLYARPFFYYYGTTLPSGAFAFAVESDPTGQKGTYGQYVYYNGGYYCCGDVEVTEQKDDSGNIIHRRTTVSFNANGGTPSTSQVKTWGVENVVQPTTPTWASHTFDGWFTASSGGTEISFPFLAPISNTTYYAQWTEIIYTSNPSISHSTYTIAHNIHTQYFQYHALNNDSSSVTMYYQDRPGTTSYDDGNWTTETVASGAYSTYVQTGLTAAQITAFGGMTIYFKAQASGKSMSSVVSLHIG